MLRHGGKLNGTGFAPKKSVAANKCISNQEALGSLHRERVMKNFLGFLVIVVVIVLGVGLYLNWFSFSSSSSDGSMNIGMQVDKDKIKTDVKKGEQKFQETTKDLQDKIHKDAK
jgi:hypothetical protein